MFCVPPNQIIFATNLELHEVLALKPDGMAYVVEVDPTCGQKYRNLWLAVYEACSNPGKVMRNWPCKRSERQWEQGDVKKCCMESKITGQFRYQGSWTQPPKD